MGDNWIIEEKGAKMHLFPAMDFEIFSTHRIFFPPMVGSYSSISTKAPSSTTCGASSETGRQRIYVNALSRAALRLKLPLCIDLWRL